MYRTASDPWTGTAAFNTYLRLQGAKVGKQVRIRIWATVWTAPVLACPSLPHIFAHSSHLTAIPSHQAWLGEKFVCSEPDQLTIGDYVSVCSAVTVVCSTGERSGLKMSGCAGTEGGVGGWVGGGSRCSGAPARLVPAALPHPRTPH